MRRRDFLGALGASVALPWQLPQQGDSPRRRINFNWGWLFRRQAHGGGALGSFDRDGKTGSIIEPEFRGTSQPSYDDSSWEEICLPHTWNAHDQSDEIPGYFRGIGWYRKHFALEQAHPGQRVFIEFEGVNQTSEFWVNGHRVGEHRGGYTSFELEITDAVHFGSQPNVLTAKVDNLYNPNISPTVKTDLTFYGGIYRDVWLRVTGPVYLSATYWRTPEVNERFALTDIYATVVNTTAIAKKYRLVHQIIDSAGNAVAEAASIAESPASSQRQTVQRQIKVLNPQLWSPDSPSLYQIRSSLFNGNTLIDETEIPLGFRWFRFDAEKGFFLNGKRLQLQGTTWHQSYPGLGSALPNSRHIKDMTIIREMGCNFFRTSHYPHDPAVMEACDKLGLLVLEEMFVGEEIENTPEYKAIQAQGCKEMIDRDRNHPSVILWGFEGELDSAGKHAQVVRDLLLKMREQDPTRLITMQDARVEGVKEILDVVGLYSTFEEDDQERRSHPERKYLIEEYTVAGIGRGIYGMGPQSEDLGCIEHEKFLTQVNARPWIAGSALWHQFDYDGEEYDPVIPHVVTFGMADSWRIPKDAYFFYQSQWSAEPMIHICGHWTWPGKEGKIRPVKVYSNAATVELFLNGRSLGTKSDEKGSQLTHPPRIWQVGYEPGELKAVAHSRKGLLVDVRRTAGEPARIDLRADVKRVTSGDREDIAELTAAVVDLDGTVVPNSFLPISFTSYGPGELLMQTWAGHPTGLTWNAIAGLTRILFRPTSRVGRAVISAYSPGLALGRTEIEVIASGRRDEMEYRSGATVYK